MSKQVKSVLKATKQLIQNKDYQAALEQCKELLALDPHNYNGLVFSGLAHSELYQRKEARTVYHDAIAAQPGQILAHQGLVSLYTKHWVVKLSEEDTEDLISSYKEIIRLLNSADVEKIAQVHINLSKAYCSIGKYSECLDILTILSKKNDSVNLEAIYDATIHCLKSSMRHFKSLIRFSDLVLGAARYVCCQVNVDITEKEEILCLLLVFLQSDASLFQKSLAEITSFLQTVGSSERNSSRIADFLNQIHLQNADLVSNDTSSSYQSTLTHYDGLYKNVVEGNQSYNKCQYEACVESLTRGVSECPDFIPAQLLLCKAYSQMHKWDLVETASRDALQACKRLLNSELDVSTSWLIRITSISDLKLDLTLCLAEALCGSNSHESWKTAVGTYEKLFKILPKSIAVCLGLAKACIKQENVNAAKLWLQKVDQLEEGNAECKCWNAYIRFLEGDRMEAIEDLRTVVVDHADSFTAHFLLGKMMWEFDVAFRIDKSKALSMLIKAAKLNPYMGETFLYLGHYYRDVAKDAGKATRCYEKSYFLGPKDESNGTALSDQYIAEGNIASAITLYDDVTKEVPAEACRWAWLRLGLCRLRTNEINAAIVCFQSALRSNMEDYICWECLGEGYLQRGSYTAAWKAFNKAHQLEPTSVYSIYQMATIKKILRQYTEAISEFNEVLSLSEDYVPALIGLLYANIRLRIGVGRRAFPLNLAPTGIGIFLLRVWRRETTDDTINDCSGPHPPNGARSLRVMDDETKEWLLSSSPSVSGETSPRWGSGESHLLLARTMLAEGRDHTCLDHINEAIRSLTAAVVIRAHGGPALVSSKLIHGHHFGGFLMCFPKRQRLQTLQLLGKDPTINLIMCPWCESAWATFPQQLPRRWNIHKGFMRGNGRFRLSGQEGKEANLCVHLQACYVVSSKIQPRTLDRCKTEVLSSVRHPLSPVDHAADDMFGKGALSCAWKLLGDCMTIVHPLDGSVVKLIVSHVLLGNESKQTNETLALGKTQALKLGGKFYCQALRVHNSASLWQDFGLNYFYQAQSNENDGPELARKSIQMLQKGLTLDEGNHSMWNCLGVVAASSLVQDHALAQHSFIKSIECEPNNVQAWSNLGSLYLDRGNIELAHRAYKTAQSLDPSFVNCWIGQSFVAESIGSEEAMDLLRHSTELGLHGQAGTGYATWVSNVISGCRDRTEAKYKETIHDLNAVVASITQLSKYCARHSSSEWAWSLYGFLLEEAGLNRSAEIAYNQSLKSLQSRLNESSDTEFALKISRAKSDCARLLCKSKNYSKAVDMYTSINPLQKYEDICGLAMALVGAGRLEEAHTRLLQAKDVASTNQQRVRASIAMVTLAWKRKNLEEAKEILNSCDGDEDVAVLQARCALAVLEKDTKQAQSAAAKLLSCDDKHRVLSEVTFCNSLLVATAFEVTDLKKAICSVQKYIYRYPSEWRFRRLLSQLHHSSTPPNYNIELAFTASEQAVASYNADDRMLTTEAEVWGRSASRSLSLHQELLSNHAAVMLCAGKHAPRGKHRSIDSLKIAQRFVHRHPYTAESWSVLAAGCHANSVLERFRALDSGLGGQCQRASSYVAMVTRSHDRLNAWSIKQNILSLLKEGNEHHGISKLLSKIPESDEDADTIRVVSECARWFETHQTLNDSLLCNLKKMSKIKASTLRLNLVSHVYVSVGMFKEALVMLTEALQSSTERNVKRKIAILIMSLVLEASSKQPAKHDEWCAMGRDGTAKAVKYAWDSPITQLMQGLLFIKSKNLKKARLALNKVFNSTKPTDTICMSKTIAAWNLYKIYMEKNDDQEMEKLLDRWREMDDPYMEKVKLLYPYA